MGNYSEICTGPLISLFSQFKEKCPPRRWWRTYLVWLALGTYLTILGTVHSIHLSSCNWVKLSMLSFQAQTGENEREDRYIFFREKENCIISTIMFLSLSLSISLSISSHFFPFLSLLIRSPCFSLYTCPFRPFSNSLHLQSNLFLCC